MSTTESPTDSTPEVYDQIIVEENPTRYFFQTKQIINEVEVEIEFFLTIEEVKDLKAKTLLINVYDDNVGQLLAETNVLQTGTENRWIKSEDEDKENHYYYRTEIGTASKEVFLKTINEKLTEIKTLVELKLKEQKKKEEEFKNQFSPAVLDQMEQEKQSEAYEFIFSEEENRSKYGPFLFAKIWVNMKGAETSFGSWPYSTDDVSNDVITIVQEVSRWRIRNKFNNIYPKNLALLALYIFSEENKGSVEPRILAIVEDIKKRYSTEFTNDLIIGSTLDKPEEDIVLTENGTQFIILLLGIFFIKHEKETKEEQNRRSWSGNATLLSTNPLCQAYQLLCKTQEDYFQSKYKALVIKSVYDITISGAMDNWFTPLPLSAQSLANLSIENRKLQSGEQSFECNACNGDNEEIYYGGWTGNEKRDKDKRNHTALCMRTLNSVIRDLGVSVNLEEKKRNGIWLNIVGTYEQAERKRKMLSDRYEKGMTDIVDYWSKYFILSLDMYLSNLAGYRNIKEGKKPPEFPFPDIEKVKEWWKEVKETYGGKIVKDAAKKTKDVVVGTAKSTASAVKGIAQSTAEGTLITDSFNNAVSAGKTTLVSAGKLLGPFSKGLALVYKLLVWLINTPLITNVITTYVSEYWKKICKELAIQTLEKGDKNAIDILKTEETVLKRFSFRTGDWTKLSPEEQEKMAKKHNKLVWETQENLGRITLSVLSKMANDDAFFERWWTTNAENKDGMIYRLIQWTTKLFEKIPVIGTLFSAMSYVGPSGIILVFKQQFKIAKARFADSLLRVDRMFSRVKRLYNSLLLLYDRGQSCLADGKLALVDGKFDELYAPKYIKAFENLLYMAPFYALNIIAQHQRNPQKSIDFYIEDLIENDHISTTEKNLLLVHCEKIERRSITWGMVKVFMITTGAIATSVALVKTGALAFAAGSLKYLVLKALGVAKVAAPLILGEDIIKRLIGDSSTVDESTKQKLDNEVIKIEELAEDQQQNLFQRCLNAIQENQIGKFVSKNGIVTFLYTMCKKAFTRFGVQQSFKVFFPNSGISQTELDGLGNGFTNKWGEYIETSVFVKNVLKHKDRNNLIFRTRLLELINRFRANRPSIVQGQAKVMYYEFHDQIVYFDAIDVSEWDQTVNPFKIMIVRDYFKAYKNRSPMQSKRENEGYVYNTYYTSERPTKECKQDIWGKIKYGRTDLRKEKVKEELAVALNEYASKINQSQGIKGIGFQSERDLRAKIKKLRDRLAALEGRANSTNQPASEMKSTIGSKQKKEEFPPVFESTFEDAEEDLSSDEENALDVFKIVGETRDSKKRRLNKLQKEFEKLNKGYRRKAGLGLFETLNSSYINSIEGRETKEKVEKLRKEINKLKFELRTGKEISDDKEEEDNVQILDKKEEEDNVQILDKKKPTIKIRPMTNDDTSFTNKRKIENEDVIDLTPKPKKEPKPVPPIFSEPLAIARPSLKF